MKEEFYLRVEGVNLTNFVYDTLDLSTTRGGGLLLLKAIDKIKERFFTQPQAISTGASSGLFSFFVENPKKADELRKKVIKFLTEDEQLRHATFVVDILPVGTDFNKDKETLLAMNRWQQMQSPTVVFPSSHKIQLNDCCGIDYLRPAVRVVKVKDKDKGVSESVYQRRKHGQNQKQMFYEQQTGLSDLPEFVQSFDELTDDLAGGNLHHKMAVIYLDGNGFGKIQRDLDKEGLQEFDKYIKKCRRDFLHNLLTDILSTPSCWMTKNDKGEDCIRLEILLWGGDEILLVVPAWIGWWTLSYFFQKSKNWKSNGWKLDNPSSDKSPPLTHAAGLVFCHHRAPIHDIQELAKRLAELAKNKSRSENYVAYQILESFDTTGPDLEDYRKRRLGKLESQLQNLIISGDAMKEAWHNLGPVNRALSKGRVYKIVQTLLYDSPKSSKTAKEQIEEAENQLTSAKDAYQKLQSCFGKDEMFWIHLIDLWDYLE